MNYPCLQNCWLMATVPTHVCLMTWRMKHQTSLEKSVMSPHKKDHGSRSNDIPQACLRVQVLPCLIRMHVIVLLERWNLPFPISLYYEGRSESKERFAIQRYLLKIGKKQNMQVLSHTFTYFSTQSPWTLRHLSYHDTSLLIPSSYQKAAWLFCGIASVRWQFRTQLYETLPDIVHTLR